MVFAYHGIRYPEVKTPYSSGHPGVRTPYSSGHPGVRTPYSSGHPGVRTPYSSGHPGVRTPYSSGHPGVRTPYSYNQNIAICMSPLLSLYCLHLVNISICVEHGPICPESLEVYRVLLHSRACNKSLMGKSCPSNTRLARPLYILYWKSSQVLVLSGHFSLFLCFFCT